MAEKMESEESPVEQAGGSEMLDDAQHEEQARDVGAAAPESDPGPAAPECATEPPPTEAESAEEASPQPTDDVPPTEEPEVTEETVTEAGVAAEPEPTEEAADGPAAEAEAEPADEATPMPEPAEAQPPETEPAEEEPAEPEAADAQPSEPEPTEQEPAEAEPAEAQPDEEEPAELAACREALVKLVAAESAPAEEQLSVAVLEYAEVAQSALAEAQAIGSEAAKLTETVNAQHDERLEAEQEEYGKWHAELQEWTTGYDSLFDDLAALTAGVEAVVGALDEEAEDFQSAPEELGKALRNRKTGLSMVGRMLARLPAKRKEPQGTSPPALCQDPLPALDEPETVDGLAEFAKQSADAYQKCRDTNYLASRDLRDAAEAVRREALSFVEHGLLPAIDGVDSGIWNTEALMEQLLGKHPEHESLIRRWFSSYPELYEQHVQPYFTKVGIEKLPAEKGMRFDEALHSALGTTSEGDLENEQIASIARNGYRLRGCQVRAAEVEVFMA